MDDNATNVDCSIGTEIFSKKSLSNAIENAMNKNEISTLSCYVVRSVLKLFPGKLEIV